MTSWVHYLAAFLLFCHGFVYVRIGSILPAPIKGWNGSSWLLGNSISTSQLTKLSIGLHVVAGIALLACVASIGLASVIPGWWRPFAIVGSLVGIVAFAVFWDGQTRLLLEEGGLGALMSLLVLAGAIVFPTAFDR
jgi:hypothetical protein